MIKWLFKYGAEPQGSSDGFWYDITDGGYIKPEEVLIDANQLSELNNALAIVRDFEQALETEGLLNEF